MAVHFIEFSESKQYWLACQVFGPPDFIHRRWDVRAKYGGEVADGDVLVFAIGSELDTPLKYSFDDSQLF